MIKNIMNWVLQVGVDFVSVGTSEDGTVMEAEVYFIEAVAKDGSRLAHNHSWVTSKEEWGHEEGQSFQYFTDTREADKKAAEDLIIEIQKTNKIDLDNWTVIQPLYGSEAYAADPQWEEGLKQFD